MEQSFHKNKALTVAPCFYVTQTLTEEKAYYVGIILPPPKRCVLVDSWCFSFHTRNTHLLPEIGVSCAVRDILFIV